MFCVITRTLVCCFLPGHVAAATCVTAKWPALGSYLRSVVLPGSATTCAGIQNLLYHARGSLRKAWRVPHSRTKRAHTPPSPLKVGIPEGAERPEPVTKTTWSPRRIIRASCTSEEREEREEEAVLAEEASSVGGGAVGGGAAGGGAAGSGGGATGSGGGAADGACGGLIIADGRCPS